MRIDGVSGFHWEPSPLARRNRGRLLKRKPCRYWMVGPTWAVLWDWIPHEGLWAWRLHREGPDGAVAYESHRPLRLPTVKKRQALGLENVPIPALPSESDIFKKFPLVREFLSVTAYEDGSLRAPGSYRFENKLICYQVTLYDADAGMRLPISAGTIDDVWKAAEKLLGAPEAPWEVDRYLTEQLAKKVKEKSSVGKKKR